MEIKEDCKISSGYAIFYTPVYRSPDMLLIGLNPGGGSDAFSDKNLLNPPTYHEYLKEDNYDLAEYIKELFIGSTLEQEFKKSIKFNLYFFRTKNENKLKSLSCYSRIKKFCEIKSLEIITKLEPRKIICEGLGVFDRVVELLEANSPNVILEDRRGRILTFSNNVNFKIYGMIHPSGGHTRTRFRSNKVKIRNFIMNH